MKPNDQLKYLPTPQEIEAECALIRAEREEAKREEAKREEAKWEEEVRAERVYHQGQPMDSNDLCRFDRSGFSLCHGYGWKRSYEALAFVRNFKSTARESGAFSNNYLPEIQRRLQVHRYRCAVSYYAGDYKLGYGKK